MQSPKPAEKHIDLPTDDGINEIKDLSIHWGKMASFVPLVVGSTISHFTVGPPLPSWSLKFHIVFNVIKHMLKVNNNNESIERMQHLTKQSFVEKLRNVKASIEPVVITTKQKAIDFVLRNIDHLPIQVRTIEKIPGEWVVCNQVPQNLKKVVYFLHGGGFVVGSPQLERGMSYQISRSAQVKVFAISYRLAPQFEFPCSLIDALSGYFHLVEDLGYDPKHIVVSGSSAGGGLAVSMLLALRELKYPFPGGAYLASPFVDATLSSNSFKANAKTDYLPVSDQVSLSHRKLSHAPNELLKSQYCSPILAKTLGDLPLQFLIQVGGVEMLLDEGIAIGKRLTLENPNSCVHVEKYLEQVHVFQAFQFLPCSRAAMTRAGEFISAVVNGRFDKLGGSRFFEFEPNGKPVGRAKL